MVKNGWLVFATLIIGFFSADSCLAEVDDECISDNNSVVGKNINLLAGTEEVSDDIPSATSELQSGLSVLSNFATSSENGSTHATAMIVNGYINAWRSGNPKKQNCHVYNAMSVDVSATLPVKTAAFIDYVRAEFLGRRNGVINLYVNPFAGRDKNSPYYRWAQRGFATDHIYMFNPWTTLDHHARKESKDVIKPCNVGQDESKDSCMNYWDQSLGFYIFGMGGRAVRTSQEGGTMAAIATLYAGFGMDGPFHENGHPEQAGGLSLEIFVTANGANANTLSTVFATPTKSWFYPTAGASFTFWLPSKLYLVLEYNKGLGSVGSTLLHDAAAFRFGYGSHGSSTSTVN